MGFGSGNGSSRLGVARTRGLDRCQIHSFRADTGETQLDAAAALAHVLGGDFYPEDYIDEHQVGLKPVLE